MGSTDSQEATVRWFSGLVPYAILALALAIAASLAGPWAYGLLVGGNQDTSKPYTEVFLVDPPREDDVPATPGSTVDLTVAVTSHEAEDVRYTYLVECLGGAEPVRCGAGGSFTLAPGNSTQREVTATVPPAADAGAEIGAGAAGAPVAVVVTVLREPADGSAESAREPLRLRFHLAGD